jgi:hypothetical protein
VPNVTAWPTSSELHAEAQHRLGALLDATGGVVAAVGRQALSSSHGLLSAAPQSLTTVLVVGACVAAGGSWRAAVWPAVGAECLMAAADLFDDADGDARHAEAPLLLTAAAGLLSLATVALVRAIDDGATPSTAAALVQLAGEGVAAAANRHALNLAPVTGQVDAVTAYCDAAARSAPLGSLLARLGGRTATEDARILGLLGDFGSRLGVRSQLLNDAGAPLASWEAQERPWAAAGGGLLAAAALAQADRLRALDALDALEQLGCSVAGLCELL